MWSKAGQLDWWVKDRQEWWENNGEAGYDIGSLLGLPYRVLRPVPELWQPSWFEPHPPLAHVLVGLRQY
jgi:hypothetical protein